MHASIGADKQNILIVRYFLMKQQQSIMLPTVSNRRPFQG